MSNCIKLETNFEVNGIICEAYLEVEPKNIFKALEEDGIEIPTNVNIQKLIIDTFVSAFRRGGSLGRINANFTNKFFPRDVTEYDESEEEDV